MKKLILISILLWILPLVVFAGTCTSDYSDSTGDCVNGDKAAWAISKVYLYTDAYCTEGQQTITILGDTVSTPGESNKIDFASAPDLGNASVNNGTYNCVATKMWDNITYSPTTTTTTGNCNAATDYTQDICGSDNTSSLTMVYDPDNSSSYSCALDSSPENEWVWIYFSTASTDSDDSSLADLENDWNPPTSDNLSNGVPLASALVVSAAASGSLKTTISSRIADTGDGCTMYKPAFSFE